MLHNKQLFVYFNLFILIALVVTTQVAAFNSSHRKKPVDIKLDQPSETKDGQQHGDENFADETGNNDDINNRGKYEDDLMKLKRKNLILKRMLALVPTFDSDFTKFSPLLRGKVLDFEQYLDSRYLPKNYNGPAGRKQQVIIFPQDDRNSYSLSHTRYNMPSKCLHFTQVAAIFGEEIATAELWVFILPESRIGSNEIVVVAEPNYTIHRKINGDHQDNPHLSGWLKFNVTDAISHWFFQRQQHNLGRIHLRSFRHMHHIFSFSLDIVCSSSKVSKVPISFEDGQIPFLILTMDRSRMNSRNKRNADCNSEVAQCCMQPLYISFKELGWDWVIAPEGYTTHYCMGSCIKDSPKLNNTRHGTVLQSCNQTNSLTPTPTHQKQKGCCKPTRTSSLKIMYLREDNLILKHLPDMIVNSCDCA